MGDDRAAPRDACFKVCASQGGGLGRCVSEAASPLAACVRALGKWRALGVDAVASDSTAAAMPLLAPGELAGAGAPYAVHIQEAEAGGFPDAQGQPELHRETLRT